MEARMKNKWRRRHANCHAKIDIFCCCFRREAEEDEDEGGARVAPTLTNERPFRNGNVNDVKDVQQLGWGAVAARKRRIPGDTRLQLVSNTCEAPQGGAPPPKIKIRKSEPSNDTKTINTPNFTFTLFINEAFLSTHFTLPPRHFQVGAYLGLPFKVVYTKFCPSKNFYQSYFR